MTSKGSSRSSRRKPVARGRVLRPEMSVLSDAALVPAANVVKPPPTHFTHELTTAQPYYYEARREKADGELAAGTRVVLRERASASRCRVIDEQGLYVFTPCAGLRPLKS